MKTNRLDYYNGENIVGEGNFRISASGISRFFTNTSTWFAENLTNTQESFKGNTASTLGVIVHGILEGYVTKNPLPVEEIDDYLVKQATIVDDLDINYINHQYPIMATVAMQYLANNLDGSEVAEEFLVRELRNGIYVGGSCDLYTDNKVIDYKTTSAKSPPKSIAYAHKLQLLTYATLLKAKGINIQYMEIVYITTDITGEISEKTGKQLKSYPSNVVVLTEPILKEDLEMITNIHELIGESVALFRDAPELRHILSQDLRLKNVQCTIDKSEEEI